LTRQRTTSASTAARARGRNGGRPKVTSDEAKVVLAKKLHANKTLEIDDICKTLRMSRSTFYRYVRL
jgi:DNA invertase Pin-like site-specific DNA recombinase